MKYVLEASDILLHRAKCLLKYDRTCESCEHYSYNPRDSLAYDFRGKNERCLRVDSWLPPERWCEDWNLIKLRVFKNGK